MRVTHPLRKLTRATELRGGYGEPGPRLHDLRHTFASRAMSQGESLTTIGKLLGHSRMETPARYAQ